MSWHPRGRENVQAYKGKICGVVKRTERAETGVDYEVLIRIEGAQVFEQGDDLLFVWGTHVPFGRESSGGPAFVAASREQDSVAAEIVEEAGLK